MSHPPSYKPSPLSFGSPRTSPFRRPESPASPSPSTTTTLRPTTPTKPHTPLGSPSKLLQTSTTATGSSPLTATHTPTSTANTPAWTPRNKNNNNLTPTPSPTRPATNPAAPITIQGLPPPPSQNPPPGGSNDPISKLPGPQVREMREGFQILDRDDDGHVTRDDVAEMLGNLGLDASPASLAVFFPPSPHHHHHHHHQSSTTRSLPVFLQTLAALLAPLSPPSDLLAAFAAFDDDDSGQVDVQELRDALLHTSPEAGERVLSEREVDGVLAGFSGRRAFGSKGGVTGRGEVFRYREFVGGLVGGGEEGKSGEAVA